MWKRIRAGLLTTGLAVAVGAPASAQVMPSVIGATIGNASARSRSGCDHFAAKDPKFIAKMGADFDKVIGRYAEASVSRDDRKARKLFSPVQDGGEFGADKQVHPAGAFSLAGEHPTQAPRLTRQNLAIGGDSFGGRSQTWAARGVWKAEPAAGEVPRYYVADLRQDPLWGNWQIWRIRAYDNEADLPKLSAAFCEFASLGGLW